MLAPPPSTRTDLDDLERIVEAKKPKIVVEELDADFLVEEDDAVDSVGSTRVEAQVYRPAPERSMPPGVPDPRRIVQQQKEFARQQELARQQEIARQEAAAKEAARQAELARQAEIARQQAYAAQQAEMARQAELARRAEAARHAEIARQQEVAREFERQEQEIARQKAEVARQQAIVREQQELARQQQEIARQKEELARAQEIARQQDLARQQALARQAEELARQQELARKQHEENAKREVAERAIVTPRDAAPMSASEAKAATLSAPPMIAEDLSRTVQGVPAPMIPEPPNTSPVLADARDEEESKPATKPTAKTLQSAQSTPVKITEVESEEAKSFTQPFRRPSSIAPVAIDVLPVQPPALTPQPPRTNTAPSAVATMPIQHMDARRAAAVLSHHPSPPRPANENHTPWIIAACVAGLFLVGGGITAAFALGSSSSSSSSTTTTSAASQPSSADDDGRPAPRTAEGTGAKLTDPTPSANDPVSVNSLPTAAPKAVRVSSTTSNTTTTATPAASPTTKVLVPAPAASPAPSPGPSPSPSVAAKPTAEAPAAPAAAPAPKAAASQTGTGTIHVAPPLVVIVVDGQHRRAVNGDVVVSCGTHKIRAGMDTQVVNVPCGGAISL